MKLNFTDERICRKNSFIVLVILVGGINERIFNLDAFDFTFRMDGLFPREAEKTYPSPPDQNLFTPPHSGRDAATEISSSERRQYNKALKAMYEIVRMGTKRLEQSVADDDDDVIPETVTETSETEGEIDGLYYLAI